MKKLMHFPYKNIVVLGLAKSGTLAANLLLENGLSVTVTDQQASKEDPTVQQLEKKGANLVLGEHPLHLLQDADLIVKNPGIPYHIPFLQEAVSRNISIVTEVELTSYLLDSKQIIGITGTNGKTTTTTLVGEIMQEDGQAVHIAGNIGVVASDEAMKMNDTETLLLELSSFQLMGTVQFHPHIAAILNLHEAHIDYHGTIDQYIEAKLQLLHNQTSADYFIYNADDMRLNEIAKTAKGIAIPFSLQEQKIDGAWRDEQYLYFKSEKIVAIKEIVLVGEHNIANILATIIIAKIKGVSNIAIQTVLRRFQGVSHRLQFVTEKNSRLFYNDSKATNVLATETALRSFDRPLVWIAGGLDRGDDVTTLLPFLKHVNTIVVFGESAAKLAALGKLAHIKHIYQVDNLEEATIVAYENSIKDDVILLSPACASWDQFKTYEERGNMFIQAVHNIS